MDTVTLIVLVFASFIFLFVGYKLGGIVKDQEWTEKIPKEREDAVKKSRTVLTGHFSEQLAPYLPDFPFSPTECKFLGKPVDLLVFKGLDTKDPEEVVFVEVKSGDAQLSQTERKLRDVIRQKKVSWYEYRAKK